MTFPENSTNSLLPTPEVACTRCRQRKIRCGRERPQCVNCTADSVDCEYAAPGKRVNHVKLLCNNVASLESHLINMEWELSQLTTFVKGCGSRASSTERTVEDIFPGHFITDDPLIEDNASLSSNGRYIVRNNSIDRYQGPGTLFALCNKFRDTTISEQLQRSKSFLSNDSNQSDTQDTLGDEDMLKSLLDRMCTEAGPEKPALDLSSDHTLIRLPPKQFLLLAQSQFFQQAHYAVAIFVPSKFRSNVEAIYNRPFTQGDEAWAVCFKTIILLVLGSDMLQQAHDSNFGSQFALSFLSTVRTALSNPGFLMAPKLINVQALALLSVAAQRYYQPGFAESILAQACVLARTMGLHQTNAIQEGIDPEETRERFKVFRSLYVRDKSFAISRGSVCWLSSFDCNLLPGISSSDSIDSSWTARIQLAALQEEVYRLHHSAGSQKQPPTKIKNAISRLEQNLERWATSHDIFGASNATASDIELQLDFLATRISSFSGSLEPSHIARTLNDSRASCVLLLRSCGKSDQATTERLEIYLPSSPSKAEETNSNDRSRRKNGISVPKRTEEGSAESISLQLYSLLDSFSVPAFFLLAKTSISEKSTNDGPQAEADLDMLRRVCDCYKEFGLKFQTNNHTNKTGRTFERLLAVVSSIKCQQSPRSPRQSYGKQSSSLCSPLNMQSSFAETPDLGYFQTTPTPTPTSSSYVTSLVLDKFTTKSTPIATSISMSIANSPPMLSLAGPRLHQQCMKPPSQKRQLDVSVDDDSDSGLFPWFFCAQDGGNTGRYNTAGQFSSNPQEQDVRPPSRRRKFLSEIDMCMDDDPDSRLLSDFLNDAPDVSFDFTA